MAAWEFQSLQNIAEKHNWHKFISMQNYHNLLYREEEREMIPYCKDTGVGLIPWSPLARGKGFPCPFLLLSHILFLFLQNKGWTNVANNTHEKRRFNPSNVLPKIPKIFSQKHDG